MSKKVSPIGVAKSLIIIGLLVCMAVTHVKFSNEIDTLSKEVEQYRFTIEDNRNTYNECWEMMNDERNDLLVENHVLREKMQNLRGMNPTVLGYNLNEYEFDLLCRCAQAEAGYGNLCSQRHVVNVILNRMLSDDFPNTISGVINHKYGDRYQFSVVQDERIKEEATEETINNIKDFLLFGDMELPTDVVYFYATGTPSNCTEYFECEGTTYGY